MIYTQLAITVELGEPRIVQMQSVCVDSDVFKPTPWHELRASEAGVSTLRVQVLQRQCRPPWCTTRHIIVTFLTSSAHQSPRDKSKGAFMVSHVREVTRRFVNQAGVVGVLHGGAQ